mgnify:CR=1 FL=1
MHWLKAIDMQEIIPKIRNIIPYISCLWPLGLLAQASPTAVSSPHPPVLTGTHGTVTCQDEWQVAPPVLSCQLSEFTTINYEDHYYNLGCQSQGFKGYFAWDRWDHAPRQGDGGVDVTGAPNSVLVEGANSASIVLTPGSQAALEVAIPASGYVMFDWSYVGGSSFSDATFEISINDKVQQRLTAEASANTFLSPILNTGDRLRLFAESAGRGFEIRLANFEFLSNALGVVEREWSAKEGTAPISTFTQLISVEKPAMDDLVFPADYNGVTAPILDTPEATTPDYTGYPVLDQDGDLNTLHDQIDLGTEACSFKATWKDEVLYEDGLCIVFRNWTVRDLCGGNAHRATQILKVNGGCPNWGTPVPRLHQIDQSAPGLDNSFNDEVITHSEVSTGLPASYPKDLNYTALPKWHP